MFEIQNIKNGKILYFNYITITFDSYEFINSGVILKQKDNIQAIIGWNYKLKKNDFENQIKKGMK